MIIIYLLAVALVAILIIIIFLSTLEKNVNKKAEKELKIQRNLFYESELKKILKQTSNETEKFKAIDTLARAFFKEFHKASGKIEYSELAEKAKQKNEKELSEFADLMTEVYYSNGKITEEMIVNLARNFFDMAKENTLKMIKEEKKTKSGFLNNISSKFVNTSDSVRHEEIKNVEIQIANKTQPAQEQTNQEEPTGKILNKTQPAQEQTMISGLNPASQPEKKETQTSQQQIVQRVQPQTQQAAIETGDKKTEKENKEVEEKPKKLTKAQKARELKKAKEQAKKEKERLKKEKEKERKQKLKEEKAKREEEKAQKREQIIREKTEQEEKEQIRKAEDEAKQERERKIQIREQIEKETEEQTKPVEEFYNEQKPIEILPANAIVKKEKPLQEKITPAKEEKETQAEEVKTTQKKEERETQAPEQEIKKPETQKPEIEKPATIKEEIAPIKTSSVANSEKALKEKIAEIKNKNAKEIITDIDVLYELLKEGNSIKISLLAKAFDSDYDLVMKWCKILEDAKLASIKRNLFRVASITIKK
jgi:hypothetical protein